MYQISLIAAFVAGMVALFAPCCITYLLPAYFGNIFKEKKRIFTMTIIYSLGIMTVMLPVVLGMRLLTQFFFQFHDTTYIIGSILMLVVAVFALLDIKLPMPHFVTKRQVVDAPSTYILGIVSGITSSCCAPVLMGVLTLSAFSPTTITALGVGVAYVAGMVAPLYLASVFIHKRNILQKPIFRQVVTTFRLGRRQFIISVSNIIASAIFALTGLVMGFLTLTSRLSMDQSDAGITKSIQNIAFYITDKIGNTSLLNLVFVFVSLYLLLKLRRIVREENQD